MLAVFPQPLPCSLYYSPRGDVRAGSPIRGASWSLLSMDSRLLPSVLCPGPRPPSLSSEDCTKNGPLGPLRTLTICILQVDLIYLFYEKEETENTLLFAGTQSCTQNKKDKHNNRNQSLTPHTTRTLQEDSGHKRGLNQELWSRDGPKLLFKELPSLPLVGLKMQK